jgi:hypothetical protein
MTQAWFVAKNKEKLGPFTLAELKKQAREGSLRPDTMLLQQGATHWRRADSVPELFAAPPPPAFAKAPPLRPVPAMAPPLPSTRREAGKEAPRSFRPVLLVLLVLAAVGSVGTAGVAWGVRWLRGSPSSTASAQPDEPPRGDTSEVPKGDAPPETPQGAGSNPVVAGKLSGQAEKGRAAVVYKTPQECFDAYTAAEITTDFKTWVGCLAPRAQEIMAINSALMAVSPRPEPATADEKEWARMVKPIEDVLKKHGLTQQATQGIKYSKDPAERQKAGKALLALIKDREAYLVDVMTATFKILDVKPGEKKNFKQRLIDLKIDGDRATGTIVVTTTPTFRDEKKSVVFVKVGAGWKIDPEPQELKKQPGGDPETGENPFKAGPLPSPNESSRLALKTLHRIQAHMGKTSSAVNGLAFSADGKLLASCGDDKLVKTWKIPAGVLNRTFHGHGYEVNNVVITPDGTILASVCEEDTTLRIWDRKTGKERAKLEVLPEACLALSPDGRTLATGTNRDASVLLIDIITAKVRSRVMQHRNNVSNVAFSADGKLLVTSGTDTSIKLWDVAAQKEKGTIESGRVRRDSSLALAPDSKALAWCYSDPKWKVWDLEAGKLRFEKVDLIKRLVFSPNGQYLVTGGVVTIYESATGKVACEGAGGFLQAASIAFSPDGKLLAIGEKKGIITILDASPLK